MNVLLHAFLFALSILIIWTLSGKLIEATDRVAKRYNKPGFAVAFFVLGMLTSIGEISVAFNSTIEGVPQVSAGNLVGASVVIFLLIIPLLAIVGKRIELDHALSRPNLALSLLLIGMPALLMTDGEVTPLDAGATFALYATLIYRLRKRKPIEQTVEETVEAVEAVLTNKRRATAYDSAYILIGALLIFFAGRMLVTESIFFTDLFGVPASIAGLLVLSLGTNVPELVIGMRSVLSKKADIAFGDYVGSGVANSLIFSFLGFTNPAFPIVRAEFIYSAMLLIPGLAMFLLFARSDNDVTRNEGLILLGLYVLFLALQITTLL